MLPGHHRPIHPGHARQVQRLRGRTPGRQSLGAPQRGTGLCAGCAAR
jgi:hypothetical protein